MLIKELKLPKEEEWPYNATHWHPVTKLFYATRGNLLYPICSSKGVIGSHPTPITRNFIVRYATDSAVTSKLEQMEKKYEDLLQALRDSFNFNEKLKNILFK